MRRKKKRVLRILLVVITITIYALFVCFSCDILRFMMPDYSIKLIEGIRKELYGYPNKLPPADIATASPKLMVIVVDALSYNILELGFRERLLPNLERIFASSCIGMQNAERHFLSTPAILTSMATGVPPKMHGVFLYFTDDSGNPCTGDNRKYHAFWHMASERGYRVAIVGWPFTWPAEDVNGYFLSAPGLINLNLEVYKRRLSQSYNTLIFRPTTLEMASAISRALEEAQKTDLSTVKLKSSLKFIEFFPFIDFCINNVID